MMQELIPHLVNTPWPKLMLSLFLFSLLRGSLLCVVFFLLYQKLPTRRASQKQHQVRILRFEARSAIQVWMFDAMAFMIFLKTGLMEASVHSLPFLSFATLLTFILIFLWVETWFYASHRAFHSPLLFRFHATHHETKVPSPISAFSFSLVERAVLFLGTMGFIASFAGSNFKLSLAGVALYFHFNAIMSVVGHCHLRIYPKRFAQHTLLKFLSDPTEHSMHHSHYTVNYGLFMNGFDRIFKTQKLENQRGQSHERQTNRNIA